MFANLPPPKAPTKAPTRSLDPPPAEPAPPPLPRQAAPSARLEQQAPAPIPVRRPDPAAPPFFAGGLAVPGPSPRTVAVSPAVHAPAVGQIRAFDPTAFLWQFAPPPRCDPSAIVAVPTDVLPNEKNRLAMAHSISVALGLPVQVTVDWDSFTTPDHQAMIPDGERNRERIEYCVGRFSRALGPDLANIARDEVGRGIFLDALSQRVVNIRCSRLIDTNFDYAFREGTLHVTVHPGRLRVDCVGSTQHVETLLSKSHLLASRRSIIAYQMKSDKAGDDMSERFGAAPPISFAADWASFLSSPDISVDDKERIGEYVFGRWATSIAGSLTDIARDETGRAAFMASLPGRLIVFRADPAAKENFNFEFIDGHLYITCIPKVIRHQAPGNAAGAVEKLLDGPPHYLAYRRNAHKNQYIIENAEKELTRACRQEVLVSAEFDTFYPCAAIAPQVKDRIGEYVARWATDISNALCDVACDEVGRNALMDRAPAGVVIRCGVEEEGETKLTFDPQGYLLVRCQPSRVHFSYALARQVVEKMLNDSHLLTTRRSIINGERTRNAAETKLSLAFGSQILLIVDWDSFVGDDSVPVAVKDRIGEYLCELWCRVLADHLSLIARDDLGKELFLEAIPSMPVRAIVLHSTTEKDLPHPFEIGVVPHTLHTPAAGTLNTVAHMPDYAVLNVKISPERIKTPFEKSQQAVERILDRLLQLSGRRTIAANDGRRVLAENTVSKACGVPVAITVDWQSFFGDPEVVDDDKDRIGEYIINVLVNQVREALENVISVSTNRTRFLEFVALATIHIRSGRPPTGDFRYFLEEGALVIEVSPKRIRNGCHTAYNDLIRVLGL